MALKLDQGISGRDRGVLKVFYSSIPHEGVMFSPEEFVDRIGIGIYYEWANNDGREDAISGRAYQGEAFRKFVDDEAHYEVERREEAGLEGAWSDENYRNARDSVLYALAFNTVKLFQEHGSVYRSGGLFIRCDLRNPIKLVLCDFFRKNSGLREAA